MAVYYNERDAYAAQWLRNLIFEGLIAPGYVDERDVRDVRPDDLIGYTQHHFFAGIGVWSYALRKAGWPDDRPVWTGSCPCQPFSTGGAKRGFADERHLWPAFYWLITQQQPSDLLGEQVASRHADPWIDLVHSDLEAVGYAFGVVPFPAAGVGAPNPRERSYWGAKRLGHATGAGLEGRGRFERANQRTDRQTNTRGASGVRAPRSINGFWRGADWIECRDAWRPIEPGAFPMAHGSSSDVGRLRAYGNAVNAQQAEIFIRAYMDAPLVRAG